MLLNLGDKAELYQEAIKYYANILTPFSGFAEKKIIEFVGLNLPVSMICPSHGILWRDNPLQIVEQYTLILLARASNLIILQNLDIASRIKC